MRRSRLQPGAIVGPYVIEGFLVAGGMSELYTARDRTLGRGAVIKILPARAADDAELGARLEAEARMLSRLRHPHLVTVYGAGTTDGGTFWLAMEWLEGRPLNAALRERRGPADVGAALELLADVAEAMAAAHAAVIIHRDLKPANIFVTAHGAKVIDFGLAKAHGRGVSTAQGVLVGSVPYMAPEYLARFDGDVLDARADIFALGVVAYEVLAGAHPFADPDGSLPDEETMVSRIVSSEPRPLVAVVPGLPEEISVLVQRMLSKRPEQRPPSMTEIARVLRAARARYVADPGAVVAATAAAFGVGAPQAGRPPRAPEASRTASSSAVTYSPASARRWTPLFGATAIGAVVAAAIAVLVMRAGAPSPSAPAAPASAVVPTGSPPAAPPAPSLSAPPAAASLVAPVAPPPASAAPSAPPSRARPALAASAKPATTTAPAIILPSEIDR